jgi:hypothetical protein
MRREKSVGLFLITFSIAAMAACGGDKTGLTDPDPITPVDTTKTPVDTAVVNAAARTAATNALLLQMDDAVSALSQSAAAGGVPTGSPPPIAGGGMSTGPAATTADAPPPTNAAQCTFDSTTVRHTCPNFTQANGLVIKTWFQFLDAAGAAHKVPDSTKTVAIRRYVEKEGVTTGQHNANGVVVPSTNTMLWKDTLVLSGLKGPPEGRKLNGVGSMSVVIVPQGMPSATVTGTTKTEDFAFTPPPTPPATATVRYPISGKVTAVVTTVRSDVPQQAGTTSQVTTYDGSKVAKLVISTMQGKVLRSCTWDMTAANVQPACTVFP